MKNTEKTIVLNIEECVEITTALLYKAENYLDMLHRTNESIKKYGVDGHMADENTYGEFLEWVMEQLQIVRNVIFKLDYVPIPMKLMRDKEKETWDILKSLTKAPENAQ